MVRKVSWMKGYSKGAGSGPRQSVAFPWTTGSSGAQIILTELTAPPKPPLRLWAREKGLLSCIFFFKQPHQNIIGLGWLPGPGAIEEQSLQSPSTSLLRMWAVSFYYPTLTAPGRRGSGWILMASKTVLNAWWLLNKQSYAAEQHLDKQTSCMLVFQKTIKKLPYTGLLFLSFI